MKRLVSLIALVMFACAPAGPVDIDPQHDSCQWCRMTISNQRLASQVVEPGEEPRLFDDLGCLSNALAFSGKPAGAQVFVADYETGSWIAAADAHFERCQGIETPMASQLVARAKRSGQPGCTSVDAKEIFR